MKNILGFKRNYLFKIIIATWLAFIIIFPVKSQSPAFNFGSTTVELGIGQFFFLGDLGGNQGIGRKFVKDFNYKTLTNNLQAAVHYNISNVISLRGSFIIGSLKGSDSYTKITNGAELDRRNRNLSFKTPLSELAVGVDVFPLKLLLNSNNEKVNQFISFSIAAGIFKFNPKAMDANGNWVELQPLHTEGQGTKEYPERKPYKLVQPLLSFGVATKNYISPSVYFGLEVIVRKLYTDYVDDVSTTYIDPTLFYAYLPVQQAQLASKLAYRENEINPLQNRNYIDAQRGTATNNDSYFSCAIKVGFLLKDKEVELMRSKRKQTRCPNISL